MFSFDKMDFEETNKVVGWSEEKPDPDFFGGLGPMNTVADFVSELHDSLFRDILGDETMDRPLGSFEKDELFRIMAGIFLSRGFEGWATKGRNC